MRSKRIQNRTEHVLTTVWAAFASADPADEAMLRRSGLPEHNEGTRVGGFFVSLSYRILGRLHDLLKADDHYQELRVRQRRLQARRDEAARRLYRRLNRARPRLNRLVRDRIITKRLKKLGATRRRPVLLCRQAAEVILVLQWRESQNEWPLATQVIQELSDELAASLAELEQALYDVSYGRKRVASAMTIQRRQMKRLDREYLHSARSIEAQLHLMGLPTLADAIRPHVGRPGRPRKHLSVDEHPDLVEQALATGLIPQGTRGGALPSATEASNPGVFDGETVLSSGNPGGLEAWAKTPSLNPGRSQALSKQQSENIGGSRDLSASKRQHTGLPDVSTATKGQSTEFLASEKLEHHLTELARDLEKLDHALSEPLQGLKIIEQPFPEHEIDAPKVGQRFTELRRNRVSQFRAAFELSPAMILPRRRRRGRPHAALNRRRRVVPVQGWTPATPRLGRVRRAASSWWERWRPAA